MKRNDCKARQYSDEMQCGRCGLCWDINDPDPPECLKQPAAVRLHGVVGGTTTGFYRPKQPSANVDTSRLLTDEELREHGRNAKRLQRIENRRLVAVRRRIEEHQADLKPR